MTLSMYCCTRLFGTIGDIISNSHFMLCILLAAFTLLHDWFLEFNSQISMLTSFSYVHLQPRTTTKPSILQKFWSIWFGVCKSVPQQLLYLLSHTEGLSMLHISHPYFSNSSLKMQKLIIGKSYALTSTRVRRGWKNFLQVIDYSHPV